MAKSVSSSSKVLGVRVPLDEYMRILAKASESKMTITDYVLQVLHFDTSELLNTTQEHCRELLLENIQLKEDIKVLVEMRLGEINRDTTEIIKKYRPLIKK